MSVSRVGKCYWRVYAAPGCISLCTLAAVALTARSKNCIVLLIVWLVDQTTRICLVYILYSILCATVVLCILVYLIYVWVWVTVCKWIPGINVRTVWCDACQHKFVASPDLCLYLSTDMVTVCCSTSVVLRVVLDSGFQWFRGKKLPKIATVYTQKG